MVTLQELYDMQDDLDAVIAEMEFEWAEIEETDLTSLESGIS